MHCICETDDSNAKGYSVGTKDPGGYDEIPLIN